MRIPYKVDSKDNSEDRIDFKNKPATEWKGNRRVYFPEQNDDNIEVENNFIKRELVKVAKEYIETNCEKNGRQKKKILRSHKRKH